MRPDRRVIALLLASTLAAGCAVCDHPTGTMATLCAALQTPPAPAPVPAPEPLPPPVAAHEVLFDLALVPDQMRASGFGPARDTVMWFALSREVAGFDHWISDSTDPESLTVWAQRADIAAWWQGRVAACVQRMRDNPLLTVTIISNAGPDRLGRFLGSATMGEIPDELRGRVTMGDTGPD